MTSVGKTKKLAATPRVHGRRMITRFGIEPAGAGRYRMAAIHMARGRVHSFDFEILDADTNMHDALRRIRYRKGAPAVLTIPRHEAILKWLRLPTNDSKQIAQMIPFEARAISPWPEQEGTFSYYVHADGSDGTASVLLVLVRKGTIENHISHLHRFGVHPTRVELATLSLGRLVSEVGNDERAAIARADGASFEFTRYWSGYPIFSRGTGPEQSAQSLLNESLALDERRHGADQACTLLVLADVAPPTDIPQSVQALVPLSEFRPPVLNGLTSLTTESMACIGAALGADAGGSGGNLLPDRDKKRLLLRALLTDVVQLAICAMIAAGLAFALATHLIREEQRFAADARHQIQALRGEVGDLDQQSAQVRLLQQEIASVSAPLELLLELYERTPNNTAISYLHYNGSRPVVLSGEASGFAAVNELLTSLSASPRFDQVQLSHTSRAQQGQSDLVEFRITLRYRAESAP